MSFLYYSMIAGNPRINQDNNQILFPDCITPNGCSARGSSPFSRPSYKIMLPKLLVGSNPMKLWCYGTCITKLVTPSMG